MKYTWLMYVLGAVLTWGAYVVTVDYGRKTLGGQNAAMRAFLFIGLAYFLMAVVVPGVWLATHKYPPDKDPGFNTPGALLCTLAGVLGAAGALCIVFAVGAARTSGANNAALYVAPLVFAGAPIVNTIIAIAVEHTGEKPKPLFFVGLLLAAAGAALVMLNKPGGHGPPAKAAAPATKPA